MIKENAFFALIDRSKYIQRWSLMRNTQSENLAEHSYMTAVFAHALAIIRQVCFGELEPKIAPDKVLAMAMYHDIAEVITGDLPTPVKYKDKDLEEAYKKLEDLATEDLLSALPSTMRDLYASYLKVGESEEEQYAKRLVKAADKLSAYVKCLHETSQGNTEFLKAKEQTKIRLDELDLPELNVFIEEFLPSFTLSLDDLRENKVIR